MMTLKRGNISFGLVFSYFFCIFLLEKKNRKVKIVRSAKIFHMHVLYLLVICTNGLAIDMNMIQRKDVSKISYSG